jgi:hypothetical protein
MRTRRRRRTRTLLRAGAALLPCVLGCSRNNERTFQDTEGQRYAARCGDKGCTLAVPSAGSAASAPPSLRATGRIVGVCKHGGARTDTPAQCRPLVCQGDKDCPPAHRLEHGTCVNGLCTEPANAISVADAVMLCLSGTGWAEGAPAQVERYALALNCGTPCKIPTPCRQP